MIINFACKMAQFYRRLAIRCDCYRSGGKRKCLEVRKIYFTAYMRQYLDIVIREETQTPDLLT